MNAICKQVSIEALNPTVRNFVEVAARLWLVSPEEFLSSKRTQAASEARFAVMLILRLRGLNRVDVAKLLNRSYWTVLYGEQRAQVELSYSPLFKQRFERLEELMP